MAAGMTSERVVAVVDDDASVRASLEDLLQSFGFGTQVFSSAEDLFQSDLGRFDCVVSDIQMPGMSGLEIQPLMRNRHCTCPVILLTAFPSEQVRARARDAGVHDFFEKPCNPDVLIASVERAVARQR
ncbi:response regulator transcription factor [Nitrospirillum amazonense]|uniref:Response regulator receiver domain-containing protein n=1 Tax=Nitrospirillum amazonense TaxID=28077 RepID=A0A560J9H7_9PROT|nr:response regulator [Nitrospirillum amazonense]MDG3439091.1 response regulator [Nitrospirillum amazonense]TWB65964.1 response regulator receiver domain-containing protein [Nitrospirillum amazonense]